MTFIEDNIEHEVSELICIKCFNRWIGVYPSETPLNQLECKCGEIGYVIKTGQTLPDVDTERFEHDQRFQNMVKMWGKNKSESEDKCKNCEYYRNPDYTRCHECEEE